MKAALLAIGLAVSTAPITPTMAQKSVAPATAPAGKCGQLARQWRTDEINLARNAVSGLTDDSVPRATMRDTEDLETYAQAQITLSLMESAHCPLPDAPPRSFEFMNEALACRLATGKATDEQIKAGVRECDFTLWKGASAP